MIGQLPFTQYTASQGMSRRGFLKVTGGLSGGLLVAMHLPLAKLAMAEIDSVTGKQTAAPNAFIEISYDNTVTVMIKHLEMGQGAFTGLAVLAAEELDADWSQMKARHAPSNTELYKNLNFGIQGVGGSTGLSNSYDQMRKAGATCRAMLVNAAADKWGISHELISVTRGTISRLDTGASLTFGDLAEAAAKLSPPEDVKLKSPSEFVLIGTKLPKLDTAEKSTGAAIFTQDIKLENMRYAMVAHPPLFGAKLRSFDDTAAKAVSGVLDVKPIPSGVAVIAKNTHAALKGKNALKIDWDTSSAETRSSAALFDEYRAKVDTLGATAASTGDVEKALKNAEETHEFTFEFPFLAHTPMETLDAVIRINSDDTVDAWLGSQLQTVDQGTIAGVVGVDPTRVNLTTMISGGSFGRRAQPDSGFAAEAAHVAKTQPKGTPVKLMWTREDDLQGGRYRPLTVHRFEGAIDNEGNISAWDHAIATQSIVAGSPFEGMIQNGIDPTSIEGAQAPCYELNDFRMTLHTMENKVPVLWWRSVGHTHTAYAVEVMMDYLLEKAGKDPFKGRMALMKEHPRDKGVLKAVYALSQKGTPAKDSARGIAVHRSFGSYVAQVAEVIRDSDGLPKVTKVWCAVDCGLAVNPDIVKAQMEGGIGFGLSSILHEEVSLGDGGAVSQTNFDTYQLLRINEMPEIEVVIVQTENPPTGVGEPGLPPIGPAVANGWRRLTGQMVTTLPMVPAITKMNQEA
ncbi:MAG: xanthine dehydrogenase family protein molybdopterin-binding subunit [Pseudomonadota bacterium]